MKNSFNPKIFTVRYKRWVIHLLLFITRKYTIINAKVKLVDAKIYSFYSFQSTFINASVTFN